MLLTLRELIFLSVTDQGNFGTSGSQGRGLVGLDSHRSKVRPCYKHFPAEKGIQNGCEVEGRKKNNSEKRNSRKEQLVSPGDNQKLSLGTTKPVAVYTLAPCFVREQRGQVSSAAAVWAPGSLERFSLDVVCCGFSHGSLTQSEALLSHFPTQVVALGIVPTGAAIW